MLMNDIKTLVNAPFFRPITPDYPIRMTPGPFEVSQTVLEAASKGISGHRSPIFKSLISENAAMLLEAFEIEGKSKYFPVVLTGTGTAAMEAMMAATVPVRKPLVLVNGRFSRRLADISTIHNPDTQTIDFGVGKKIDVKRVEKYLNEHPQISMLSFCAQDTREGILNPYRELSKLAKEKGLYLCIDTISAMVFQEIRPDELGIDFFTSSSGKGVRCLPGLGIVCGKIEEFETLDPKSSKTYYLNLYDHYRIQRDAKEPRFAPAVSLYYALNQALKELLEEGLANRRELVKKRSALVRQKMKEFGLELLHTDEKILPNSITSVLLPGGISFDLFQSKLQEKGFLVYSGSSVIKDCFQVGTGGYLTDEVLLEGLEAIKITIEELRLKST